MVNVNQNVAVLIDGNNIEISARQYYGAEHFVNYDIIIENLLNNRNLSRLIYFREGFSISEKFATRLKNMFLGTVVPCGKSADIKLTIKAIQIAPKVDTIIILSGDQDYIPLLEELSSNGVRTEMFGIAKNFHKDLVKVCDCVTYLNPKTDLWQPDKKT